jgi:ABC-2 type transport system permease protein
MLRSMLWFELKYHFSQITFKIAVLLFFILGIMSTTLNFGSEEVHKNAPYVVSTMVSLLALFSIFVSTLFCANVVLRDTTYKMESLLFTTESNACLILRSGSWDSSFPYL